MNTRPYLLRCLLAWSTAAACCVNASAYAQDDERSRQEIVHLLDYVTQQGCQINRNGSWYDSKAAREHLQQKYDYLQRRKLAPDAKAFIERAASSSSMSGKAYMVRCGNGQPVPSAEWLNAELSRYRAAHAAQPALHK
jgi:hypothetical protein